jgi:hypothetical protein
MDCKDFRKLLYEFATNRLGNQDFQLVEGHIKKCSGCQAELNELKETLLLLNEWEAPVLSPGFRVKVMAAIEERVERKSVPIFKKIISKVFQPYYLKFPIQGLAVAAMILLAVTIYKNFIPEPDRTTRDFTISPTYVEAKNPILIEVKEIDEALNKVKEIIKTHQGSLVRRRPVEGGLEVTFKIEKEHEENILKKLSLLGKFQKGEAGFKNSDGNIVIILKKK